MENSSIDGVEVSIVIETYNLEEGTEFASLRRAIQATSEMVSRNGSGEVLLADTVDDGRVHDLAGEFPSVRRVDAKGAEYDVAKARAVEASRGRYILWLDGDCNPVPNWLELHLHALKSGEAPATCGMTRYKGGFFAKLLTVMDFGFLIPATRRVVGCYPSNNCGFIRNLLLDCPVPEGPLRCRCYAHAQALIRRGTPMLLLPEAGAVHDLPEFLPERLRRGFDLVAACWVDPDLPEAALLEKGLLAAPIFYGKNVRLDWQRLAAGRRDVGMKPWEAALAAVLFPLIRLVDIVGIVRALRNPGRPFPEVRRSTSERAA